MAPRAKLLLVLLLLLVPSVGAQDDEEPPASADALYFMDEVDWRDGRHFTTYPPEDRDQVMRFQFTAQGNTATAMWPIEPLPVSWNTTDGASRAVIYLAGLDEMLPVPSEDPDGLVDSLGSLRIDVSVLDGFSARVLHGRTLYEPRPLEPREEAIRFEIDLDLVDTTELEDLADIEIAVSGRNQDGTNISPVHLHFGADPALSHLRLEGFPYAPFRSWEDDTRLEWEHNRNILTGNETPAPSPGASGNTTKTANGIPAVNALAILSWVVWWSRRINNVRR